MSSVSRIVPWSALALLVLTHPVASIAAAYQAKDAADPVSELEARIVALEARDPYYKAEEDLTSWNTLLAATDERTPERLIARILQGQIISATLADEYALVRELYPKALAFVDAHGIDDPSFWKLHLYGSTGAINSRDFETADKAMERAEAMILAGYGPDSAEIATLFHQKGLMAFGRDDLKLAVELHTAARDMALRHFDENDTLLFLIEMAHAYRLSNLDRQQGSAAFRALEQKALANKRLPLDHPQRYALSTFLVDEAVMRGRFNEALEMARQTIDLGARIYGKTSRKLFEPVAMAALVLGRQGKHAEAEAAIRQSFIIGEANAGAINGVDLGMGHAELGSVILAQGRVEEARAVTEKGLAMLEGLDPGDLRWAHIEIRLADTMSIMGEHDDAIALSTKAIESYRQKLPANHPLLSLHERMAAVILARAGRSDQAYESLKPFAERTSKELLDLLVRERQLSSLAGQGHGFFEYYTWLALNSGHVEEGVRFAQLSALSDLAGATAYVGLNAVNGDQAITDAVEEIRTARVREAAARKAMVEVADRSEEERDAARAELDQSLAAVDRLEARLIQDFPQIFEILRPRPASIADIKASLSPDQAIILPISLGDRFVVLAITDEAVIWDEASQTFNEFYRLTARLRQSIDASMVEGSEESSSFDAATAHQLYQRIFTPKIAAAVEDKNELIFSASGPMANIPPSLLVTEEQVAGQPIAYLIRRHAVSIRSSLLPVQPPATSQTGRRFAGIGDPVLAAARDDGAPAPLRSGSVDIDQLRELPSLPATASELKAMQAAFGGDDSLLILGRDANEEKVKSLDLNGYAVLAFATHGLVSGEIDGLDEPALVLTPPTDDSGGDTDDDGLLRASEIARMSLDADWVILSACNTGAGAGNGRPTYSGLARSFRLAGARSLLLSHWRVRDDAAARLTVDTVKGAAAGLDRAEALRQAQLALIDDVSIKGGAHPAIWAPFILIGS